jgi:hypothetical protein
MANRPARRRAPLLPPALDVREIASVQRVTHPITDEERVLDNEAHIVGLEGNPTSGLFVYQRGEFHGGSAPGDHGSQEEFAGLAGLNNRLYQHDFFVLHVEFGPVVNLDVRRRPIKRLSLRLHKLTKDRDVDGANQVRGKNEAILEHANEHQILPRIVAGYLLTHLSYPALNLLCGE